MCFRQKCPTFSINGYRNSIRTLNGRKRYVKWYNVRFRLRLLRKTGNIHRSGVVRFHIFRGDGRQRIVGIDIYPAQTHDQRTEHLHTQPGAWWSVSTIEQHTVHVNHIHGNWLHNIRYIYKIKQSSHFTTIGFIKL